MKEERGYKAALHMGPNPVWERGDCHEAACEVMSQLTLKDGASYQGKEQRTFR